MVMSCFNFLNKMTRDQLMLFGNSVGYLGLTLSGYQTYIALQMVILREMIFWELLLRLSVLLVIFLLQLDSSLLLEWSVLLDVLLVLFLR